MNGWDLFTWICAGVLGVSAILIFFFFLLDICAVLGAAEHSGDEVEDDPGVGHR